MQIRIEGLEEVKRHVNPARWQKFITEILRAAEGVMLPKVQSNAPVGPTGQTRTSINARRTRRSVKVGPGATDPAGRPYPRFVEFGTRRGIRGQRFMRASMAESRPGIERVADQGARGFAQGRGM